MMRRINNTVFPKKDTVLIQSIRGHVFERETLDPLSGATVLAEGHQSTRFGAIVDGNGNFVLDKIHVGRHTLKISYVGFKPVVLSIMVDASRQSVVEVPMEPSPLYLSELKIHSVDDVAPVGANLINTDDLNRHAGNRGEAIRKVSVLPGIQSADDSRNDIIIRGNSPQSVLWRIEGVNIPNPNHFNIPGTSGGPVSIINDRMLASSSFYSGAFPAEFGNTTSGIFDLQFVNGDSSAHHSTFQLGLLGVEWSAGGPLSTSHKSSYVFAVRRSTLGFFKGLNINIGTEAVPQYTDASFKINFPLKNHATLSIFGLGGRSKVDILISRQKDSSWNLYGEKDRDQYFRTGTGTAGISYKRRIRGSGYLKTVIAISGERIRSHHDFVDSADVRQAILDYDGNPPGVVYPPILNYNFRETRVSGVIKYAARVKKANHIHVGISVDQYFFHFLDNARNTHINEDDFGSWRFRWKYKGNAALVQPFVEWRHTVNKLDIIAGLHHQYFSLNNSISVAEPRVGIRYYLNEKVKFNAGIGLHSQMQQPYLYFYGATNDSNGVPIPDNIDMGFTRSRHLVAGIEKHLGSDSSGLRIKIEGYHQRLFDVPVETQESSFSLVNTGADFVRLTPGSLVNDGVARNYGIEVTAERGFSRGYLLLVTGSVFQSEYKGSDNVWRNSDFNGKYLANILFTREWILKEQNILSLGTKFITAGGRWYGPVNDSASIAEKRVVYISETKNTKQFQPYYRVDVRASYKINLPKVSHEIAVDLINIFNKDNVLKLTYIPGNADRKSRVSKEYQLGTLPFFYYRINF